MLLGTHLLSRRSLSPSLLSPHMEDPWKTSTASGTEGVLTTWAVCVAHSLFALVDIPVETDMLLALIQSLVVDPENERLVRKMSHRPALPGNQQVRKASPSRPGNSLRSLSLLLPVLENAFSLSSLYIIRQQRHLSNLCAVCLRRLYVCNSFTGIRDLQINLARWPGC